MMIIVYVLLLLLLGIVISDNIDGSWIHLVGKDYDRVCVDLNMCTLGGYTRTEVFDLLGYVFRSTEYDKDDVSQAICRSLVEKEKKVIFILGDSYMRHIFQAMVSLISGNTQAGSLKMDNDCIQKCQGVGQFYKHGCASDCIVLRHLLCGGLIQIHFIPHTPPSVNYCTPNSVQLWSEGNHPINGDKGHEYNNATYWTQKFNSLDYGMCTYLKNAESHECNLYWISSHQRLNKFNPNEDEKLTKTFNGGMYKYFEGFKNCGSNTKYADTYDFTHDLIKNYPVEAAAASPDGIHWGLSVNLIKAVRIIIDITK